MKMACRKYYDLNKIDPGWARKHKCTLWASGVSTSKIDQICAKPSFSELAKGAEEELALDEALAQAKEEGAREALKKAAADNTKGGHKNNTAKPSALKDTTIVSMAAVPANNPSDAPKNVASEEKKAGSGKPNFTFSADDDKQLLELKNEGKSWKEIAKALKKPQDALKNRFKEIGPNDEEPAPQQKKESKKESKKAGRAKTNENAAAPVADQGGEEWDVQTVTGGDDNGEYMILYPDNIFNEDALVAMARAMYEDHDNFYQRIVSRIFDATGQRFSESAVKRKLAKARSELHEAKKTPTNK